MAFDMRSPSPIDIYVGGRVRMRRKVVGISQEALAECLDLTFQQVQKYEKGSNRISASKLHQISLALKVPVSYFFAGYQDRVISDSHSESASQQPFNAFLATDEGIELAAAFPKIRSAKHRRTVLQLVMTLAEEG